MPKIVDREMRRAELAGAFWRVLAREGIENVSVRSVAAEAGQSRDAIRHYFGDKEGLLRHAWQLASERTLAKVRATHATLTGRRAVRAVLLDDLMLDGKHRESMGVWLGLLSAACREADYAVEFVRFDENVRVVLAEMIAEMIARGEASANVDPDASARSLLTFNLGLALRERTHPERYRHEVVEAEVEAFLDSLQGSKA